MNRIKLDPDLLAVVIGGKGKPVARQDLLAVFSTKQGFTNIVDVYINYLRGKIGKDRILTVRGVGYQFQEVGE